MRKKPHEAIKAAQQRSDAPEISPTAEQPNGSAASAAVLRFASIGLLAAIVLPRLPKAMMPPCPIRAFTGLPCPSCGLTHSFGALLSGSLEASLRLNPLGAILFAGAVVTLVASLIVPKHTFAQYAAFLTAGATHFALAISLLIFDCIRIIHNAAP